MITRSAAARGGAGVVEHRARGAVRREHAAPPSGTSNSSSAVAAASIVGQSESLPMIDADDGLAGRSRVEVAIRRSTTPVES